MHVHTFSRTHSQLYATDSDFSRLFMCDVTPTTGALDCSGLDVGGLDNPYGIALSDTKAYIGNDGSDVVLICDLNKSTGVISNCLDSGVQNLLWPNAMVISGNYLYILDMNDGGTALLICAINSDTGALSGCTPDGSFQLFSARGIIASNGKLFISDQDQGRVFVCTIDSDTGLLSGCTDTGATQLTSPRGMATLGNFFWIGNNVESTIILCTVDVATGALSNCGETANGTAFSLGGFFARLTHSSLCRRHLRWYFHPVQYYPGDWGADMRSCN